MSSAPTSLPAPAASSEAFAQPASRNHGVSEHVPPPSRLQPVQFDKESESNRRREGQKNDKPGRKGSGGALNPFAKEFVPGGEPASAGFLPDGRLDSHNSRPGGRNRGSSNGNLWRSRGGQNGSPRDGVIFREDLKKTGSEQGASGGPSRTSSRGGLSGAFKSGGHGQADHRPLRSHGSGGQSSSSARGHRGQSSASNSRGSGGGNGPPGGRKNQGFNANHLLNFQYDAIPRPQRKTASAISKVRKPQAYDKELFLQANFRFLVSDFGDYMLNTSDPDKMLEWEDVAAVNFAAPVPVHCPICLDLPLCPQITTCGHIFCFPCILRYMLLGLQEPRSDHWKKCPLCFAMVSSKELRTVLIDDVHHYRVGDKIKLSLLMRAKGSILPFEKAELASGPLAYGKNGQCHLFSKFTLTSDAEPIMNKAIAELSSWAERVQEEGGEDMDRLPFVFLAMDQLRERKDAWTEHRTTEFLHHSPPVRQRIMAQAISGNAKSPGIPTSLTPQKSKSIEADEDHSVSKLLISSSSQGKSDSEKADIAAEIDAAMAQLKGKAGWVYESAFSDDEGEVPNSGIAGGSPLQRMGTGGSETEKKLPSDMDAEPAELSKSLELGKEDSTAVHNVEMQDRKSENEREEVQEDAEKMEQQVKKDQEERETYTFYQSADGQTLTLHPINVKCLLHHYGSYDALPASLEAELVELESVTQTEATRKRYRYLSHLPLTAIFQLCEVDLSKVLPESSLAPFSEELRNREGRRRRIVEQNKEEKALEDKLAAAKVAHLVPPTDADFAAVMSAAQLDDPFASGDFTGAEMSSPVATMSPTEQEERRLFSRVAKLGFASGYDAPDLVSDRHSAESSPGSSPFASAWNTDAGPSRGPISFADIIVAQTPTRTDPEEGSVPRNRNGGTKKGKKGSKVIMSTAGGRRY